MIKKVLIIDDDKDMCEELSEILKDEGYSVHMIFNGSKVEKLIERYAYDILLLDLKLPGLDGFNILKMAKGKNMKLRILVLTGKPLNREFLKPEEANLECREQDILKLADGIMNKPFDIKMVLEKIKELTE